MSIKLGLLHLLRLLNDIAPSRLLCMAFFGLVVPFMGGCATIRVTDSFETADQQFLLTEAARKAVAQLSLDPLRGRGVWVVSDYAFSTTQPFDQSFFTNEVRSPNFETSFMIGELRSRLLQSGARLVENRDKAEVVLEVHTGALAINRIDFLLGLSAFSIPGVNGSNGSTAIPAIATSTNLALYQNIQQKGFAAVSVVAYWRNTGELLNISGPFIGRTFRNDYLLLGYELPPNGNIPPTQTGPTR
jgi:hypothetical protein